MSLDASKNDFDFTRAKRLVTTHIHVAQNQRMVKGLMSGYTEIDPFVKRGSRYKQ